LDALKGALGAGASWKDARVRPSFRTARPPRPGF